jgi:hypothetical protein
MNEPPISAFERVVAKVLLSFGLACALVSSILNCAFIAFMIWTAITRQAFQRQDVLEPALFLLVFGTFTLFCLFGPLLLILSRPNKYQSMVPRWGWFLLMFFFAATTAAIYGLDHSTDRSIFAIASSAVLTAICAFASRIFHTRGKASAP